MLDLEHRRVAAGIDDLPVPIYPAYAVADLSFGAALVELVELSANPGDPGVEERRQALAAQVQATIPKVVREVSPVWTPQTT